MGNLEGKDRRIYSVDKYWDYYLNSDDENVERIQDVFKRCSSFLEDLKKNYNDSDTILIVSHSAVIRCLHHIILNSDLSKNF